MSRRFPNNYGGITKLSGKRKKPYMVYINKTIAGGIDDPETLDKLNAISVSDPAGTLIDIANAINNDMDISEEITAFIESIKKKCVFSARYKKIPLGYFTSYKDASIYLADYNKFTYDPTENHTFAELYTKAFEDAHIINKAKTTIIGYNTAFNNCLPIHNKNIRDIRLNDLQAIIDGSTARSISYQTNIIKVMKLVYSYAIKHDITQKDYSQFVKIVACSVPKEKRAFTPEEINKIWNNIDMVIDGVNISELIIILLYTGVRIGELLSVELKDINGDLMRVHGTKTKVSNRIVPIHPDIMPIIKKLQQTNKRYLLEDHNGDKLVYKTLERSHIHKFNRLLNMKHTYHETRHTFATYSTDMETIMRSYIIGHTNRNITDDIYTHPEMLQDKLRSEILKLNTAGWLHNC